MTSITQLRNLNLLLFRAFENVGLEKINRDANGKPVGLVIEVEAHARASSSSTAQIDAYDQRNIPAPAVIARRMSTKEKFIARILFISTNI